MLSAHNAHRSKHCVPALTWSSELAAAAQEFANGCKKDGNVFAHSGTAGENLAWGADLSGTGSVDLWYDEIGKYNFASPSWSNAVAHFTQVVWRNSGQIGCAMSSCGGQNYWVCRYSPPGNFNVTPDYVSTEQARQNLMDNVPPPCIEHVRKPPRGFKPGEPPPIESVPKPRRSRHFQEDEGIAAGRVTGNFLKQ
jgi:hypothetical protein